MNNPKAPLLDRLAIGCHNGACNPVALIRDLAQGITTEFPYIGDGHQMREDPRVKYIVAHIAFLFGQAAGPDTKTFEAVKRMAEHSAAPVKEDNPIVDMQNMNKVNHFVRLYNDEQISTKGCLEEIKKIVSN